MKLSDLKGIIHDAEPVIIHDPAQTAYARSEYADFESALYDHGDREVDAITAEPSWANVADFPTVSIYLR